MFAISAADRFAIEDVLGHYMLAVDLADVDGVLDQFALGAVVRYDSGERYEGAAALRDFALRAIGDPSARRRMHFNRTLFAEADGAEIVLRSYLAVPEAKGPGEACIISTLRYVEDRFCFTPQGWRIRERAIHRWPLAQAGHSDQDMRDICA